MAGVLGNVSFTEYCGTESVKKIVAFWYTGSGDYNGIVWNTTANYYDGVIYGGCTYTNAGLPTNAYNVRVFDKDSHDILAGTGLARTNTASLPQPVNFGAVSHSKLNIYIANANFNRNGTVILYIR